MARPQKKGLGYFPMDTDFLSDRKIQRLIRRYGCDGICTYLCVLCFIYGENGYFIRYDSDLCFDISFKLGLDEELVQEIVCFCVQIRLFDEELLAARQILSSRGVQDRFKEISKSSPRTILPEFDLSLKKEFSGVNNAETGVSMTKTPDPGALLTRNEPKTDINTHKTGVSVTKTPDPGALLTGNEPETDFNRYETGVSATKTPINGNGNINRTTTTKKSFFYGNKISSSDEEAGRRAELLRMATDATRGDRNA